MAGACDSEGESLARGEARHDGRADTPVDCRATGSGAAIDSVIRAFLEILPQLSIEQRCDVSLQITKSMMPPK
jgi:hypothetical protein